MSAIGFDNDLYIQTQTKELKKAVQGVCDSLIVEFGGKIIQDRHAARVLPGYHEDAKLELVKALLPDGEAVFVVSAKDIISGRVRGDFKTTYAEETIRSLAEMKKRGLEITKVALTRLDDSSLSDEKIIYLIQTLEKEGMTVYYFFEIAEYIHEINFGSALSRNSYIETNKQILLVISPGGGSGKFNVCLSQLYKSMRLGKIPTYVKLETFPVFNLPVHHPIHLAFMAASADFFDEVMLDHRHTKVVTSYNRDIENYELLRRIGDIFQTEGVHLREISSATSMGINRIKDGIIDDELVQKEAAAEIARRFMRYTFEVNRGETSQKTLSRCREILKMLWES